MTASAVYEVVECVGCESPNLPSSTVCGECGQRLVPPAAPAASGEVVFPVTHGPDCPCVPCTLETYDNGRAL